MLWQAPADGASSLTVHIFDIQADDAILLRAITVEEHRSVPADVRAGAAAALR